MFAGRAVIAGLLAALGLAVAWRDVTRVLAGGPHTAAAPDERGALWTPWGDWLTKVVSGAVRPLIAGVAGVVAVVPFVAATGLAAILFMPFLLVSIMPAPSRGSHVARAVLLAAISAVLSAGLGPTLYRWIYPASLAAGATYLHQLAWISAALLLAPLWRPRDPAREPDQRLAALGAVASAALLDPPITR